MYFFFDYFYYRITKIYYKEDQAEGFIGNQAISVISFLQVFFIATIIELLSKNIHSSNSLKYLDEHFNFVLFALLMILFITNYIKYKGKYQLIATHWKDEKKGPRILKGFLATSIIIGVYLAFFLVIIYYRGK